MSSEKARKVIESPSGKDSSSSSSHEENSVWPPPLHLASNSSTSNLNEFSSLTSGSAEFSTYLDSEKIHIPDSDVCI